MKKTFVEIFKQMIPVIIGILVALFINSWNEKRKDENYIEEISKSIKVELEESLAEIVEKVPKQQRLIDTMRHYVSNDALTLMEVAIKADGFHAPRIRTNAWEAISRTKIELVNYNKLKVLSDIKTGKELLQEKETFLLNFVYSNIYNKSAEAKQTVMFLVIDIMGTERGIKQDIECYAEVENL